MNFAFRFQSPRSPPSINTQATLHRSQFKRARAARQQVKLHCAQSTAASARKMARPIHGLLRLRPLLLAVCCLLLLQVSECSRPSPSPSPADHVDDALHHQLLMLDAEARTAGPPTSTEVAGDGRTGADHDDAAAPSASATTPARAVPAVVASSGPRQTSDRALLVRAGMTPAVLRRRSKLARRVLAGEGVDEAASSTDGAAPSCHSNNPHINCGPSASKP